MKTLIAIVIACASLGCSSLEGVFPYKGRMQDPSTGTNAVPPSWGEAE